MLVTQNLNKCIFFAINNLSLDLAIPPNTLCIVLSSKKDHLLIKNSSQHANCSIGFYIF